MCGEMRQLQAELCSAGCATRAAVAAEAVLLSVHDAAAISGERLCSDAMEVQAYFVVLEQKRKRSQRPAMATRVS
jgi:hypothetical protein